MKNLDFTRIGAARYGIVRAKKNSVRTPDIDVPSCNEPNCLNNDSAYSEDLKKL